MRYCCIACMSQNLGNTKVNLVTSNNLQFHRLLPGAYR